MTRQRGFGLLEVMIGFILVAVTAGTLLQLNKVYLEYSRDGRSREVAMRLAESKLDELRRFHSRGGFAAISNGSDSKTLDDTSYQRSWVVTGYGWSEADEDWVTPVPAGVSPGKKRVTVTVNWNDASQARTLSLSSVLSPVISATQGPFGSAGDGYGTGLGGPGVGHTPGVVPAVIPVPLDPGLKMETSRPQPEVIRQGESTRVELGTVTYDGDNIARRGQDLATVSCRCTLGSSSPARLPAQPLIPGDTLRWRTGTERTKQTGAPANQSQDVLCGRCCGNHFDGPDEDFSHWYDVVKRGSHGHYSAGMTPVINAGSDYLEACRLVRLDGRYEVATDWNLVTVNIFDADLLLDATLLGAYQDYVELVVREYIRSQIKAGGSYEVAGYYLPPSFAAYLAANSISPATTAITMDAGLRQLMARGIYVDIISAADRQYLLSEVMANDADAVLTDAQTGELLSRVPFNEVNLTLLADWSSDDGSVTVTNEPVETINDADTGYYGVYSRGLARAVAAGSATVTASVRRSNSGVTASGPLSPAESQAGYAKSSQLVLTVNATQSTVVGEIYCVSYSQHNNNWRESECSAEGIEVRNGGTLCEQFNVSRGNKATPYYNCIATPGATALLSVIVPDGYQVYTPAGGSWSVAVPPGATTQDGGCLVVTQNRPDGKTPVCR